MHTVTRRVGLRDTDAGGFMFFARHYAIAHDVYEEYLQAQGMDFQSLLKTENYILPVVHSECDYRRPLWLGEQVTVRMRLAELKKYSYTFEYEYVAGGESAALVRLVHVAVDRGTRKVIALPQPLADILKAFPKDPLPEEKQA